MYVGNTPHGTANHRTTTSVTKAHATVRGRDASCAHASRVVFPCTHPSVRSCDPQLPTTLLGPAIPRTYSELYSLVSTWGSAASLRVLPHRCANKLCRRRRRCQRIRNTRTSENHGGPRAKKEDIPSSLLSQRHQTEGVTCPPSVCPVYGHRHSRYGR